MFPGYIPMPLPGALNAEEIAAAEAIRAKQLEYISSATPEQIAGTAIPTEQDEKNAEDIEESQIALNKQIWERFDPGATLRRADAERQFNEFVAKMNNGEVVSGKGEAFPDDSTFDLDSDHDPYDPDEAIEMYKENPSLKQKVDGIIKKLFKRD